MKDWAKFTCSKFHCVFYDQDTDICDYCVCNDKNYKEEDK